MDIYEEIIKLRRAGRHGALATIIQVQGSVPSFETSKLLVRDDGSIVGTVGGGCVEADVWAAAQDVMQEERPRRLHFNLNNNPEQDTGLVCGGSLDIYIEPVLATPTLYLLGGGHVSKAVSRVASIAGFETVVLDDRSGFANAERFPEAVATHAGPWPTLFSGLQLNNFSYILICTRGHQGDLECLRWALTTPARYIGMIGSRRKRIEFAKVLAAEGTPSETLDRLQSPAGLDVGALTPEEIAVAVVAQMIAVRRNHGAGVPAPALQHHASH
jgi:xanthine dehydrogenase accessory factor